MKIFYEAKSLPIVWNDRAEWWHEMMMQPTSFMLLPVIYDNAAGRSIRTKCIITLQSRVLFIGLRVRPGPGRLKIAATYAGCSGREFRKRGLWFMSRVQCEFLNLIELKMDQSNSRLLRRSRSASNILQVANLQWRTFLKFLKNFQQILDLTNLIPLSGRTRRAE